MFWFLKNTSAEICLGDDSNNQHGHMGQGAWDHGTMGPWVHGTGPMGPWAQGPRPSACTLPGAKHNLNNGRGYYSWMYPWMHPWINPWIYPLICPWTYPVIYPWISMDISMYICFDKCRTIIFCDSQRLRTRCVCYTLAAAFDVLLLVLDLGTYLERQIGSVAYTGNARNYHTDISKSQRIFR